MNEHNIILIVRVSNEKKFFEINTSKKITLEEIKKNVNKNLNI